MTTQSEQEDLRSVQERIRFAPDACGKDKCRVIVGLGTCGIAAGGRGVMQAVLEELQRRNIHDVAVETTGCAGMCQNEPLLDVVRPGEERVTYGRVTPGDVPRIIEEHLLGGRVVRDLVVHRPE
ncbi:ferredoxin-like protein [Aminomonas paucivorans DSM 12260]|uniref:Ferredoxin-like protein n=1 Tax=Aminomonas paucivorans DSM 12260 TaxID=584708 RepID=E3CVK7_9BACT|nr:(2Fe-2S) ferredoxin domain-containing protein [Aminomonas paucivorans]EFQ24198.1 ferredoxin-like protein [Aminomonas paucivorans DSM 12260]